MVADITKQIARDYEFYSVMQSLSAAHSSSIKTASSATNWSTICRSAAMSTKRIRMVDALQFHEENGEVCPAGWNRGDEGMKATAKGVASYLGKKAKKL